MQEVDKFRKYAKLEDSGRSEKLNISQESKKFNIFPNI
jgi:hypothetical protein